MATAAMARTMTDTVPAEPTLQMRLRMPVGPQPKAEVMRNKLKNRLRLDASRALEPARKKIATIEAQRVMSVFEDTIQKSEVMTLLPFILQNIDRFRITLGSELSDLLEHHLVILESYEDIKLTLDRQMKGKQKQKKGKGRKTPDSGGQSPAAVVYSPGQSKTPSPTGSPPQSRGSSARSSQRGGFDVDSRASSAASNYSIDSQVDRTMRNLTLVAQQLNTSCKNVLRGFYNNPAAMNAIKQELARRDESSKQLVTCMSELRDILLNKLLTTPEEEKERMEYLQEISKRERHNAAVIEKLEVELKAAQDDKDDEIKKKNDVIRRLQADLRQVQKFSEDLIRRVKTEAEKQEASDNKNSDARKQRLQQDVGQLKTQAQNLILEHRESEQDLRRKKFKIETEVENWIQKYDQDMGERQNEYEEIDLVYTEEKKQLHELEERFKTLETEYQQIMEERRLARERREAAERELAMVIKASTTIQAFWRSFKVRKALKARKKKGGKKKK